MADPQLYINGQRQDGSWFVTYRATVVGRTAPSSTRAEAKRVFDHFWRRLRLPGSPPIDPPVFDSGWTTLSRAPAAFGGGLSVAFASIFAARDEPKTITLTKGVSLIKWPAGWVVHVRGTGVVHGPTTMADARSVANTAIRYG